MFGIAAKVPKLAGHQIQMVTIAWTKTQAQELLGRCQKEWPKMEFFIITPWDQKEGL